MNSYKCPYCQSHNLGNYGYRKTKKIKKKRYICKECNRTFTKDDNFLKSHHPPELILKSIRLNIEGVSLSSIQKKIKRNYNEHIARSSVVYWKSKYKKIVEDYMDIIIRTLKMHLEEGKSLTEIQKYLKTTYNMETSKSTIINWIDRYSNLLKMFFVEERYQK